MKTSYGSIHLVDQPSSQIILGKRWSVSVSLILINTILLDAISARQSSYSNIYIYIILIHSPSKKSSQEIYAPLHPKCSTFLGMCELTPLILTHGLQPPLRFHALMLSPWDSTHSCCHSLSSHEPHHKKSSGNKL